MADPRNSNPDPELPNDYIEPEVVQRFRARFRTATSGQVKQFSKESFDWFRREVSKNFNPKPNQIIETQSSFKKYSQPNSKGGMVGRLYLFKYKAEEAGDADTGLYDQYPMIFIFNAQRNKAGQLVIYGLNVHYLSPQNRQILFEELMKTRSSRTTAAKTKLQITWKIIKAVCKSELFSKAVHAYRVDRIESQLVEIGYPSWPIVVFLRLEKFIAPKVHEETQSQSTARKKIQRPRR